MAAPLLVAPAPAPQALSHAALALLQVVGEAAPDTTRTVLAITMLFVFVLAAFIGYEVITRVPPLLHTPLMSATNAISGISLVGSLVLAGSNHDTVSSLLGFIAVTAATINVVGGFLITDRMLKMFRKRLPGGAGGDKAVEGGKP